MKKTYLLPLLFFLAIAVWAQNRPIYTGLSDEEQLAFVGMMMVDLLEQYGPPRTVIVERGEEAWQDDVVFQYNGADFYIYRDRVWQVKFASTLGVSNGDRKTNVIRVLGMTAEDFGDHVLLSITGKDWPLMLRVNFNNTSNSGQVTAIYLYRPDF
ncbi:MAG: hypothetical protein FWD47_05250 [Treponema sp.]|nr:hypothetical protein [Treponema sp.]